MIGYIYTDSIVDRGLEWRHPSGKVFLHHCMLPYRPSGVNVSDIVVVKFGQYFFSGSVSLDCLEVSGDY